MALYKGERRLTSLQWHQATSIEVRFRSHKGDQVKQGSVIVAHCSHTQRRLWDAFWGRSRRRCRRSHGGVTVGISDDAGKRPLVVVSVR